MRSKKAEPRGPRLRRFMFYWMRTGWTDPGTDATRYDGRIGGNTSSACARNGGGEACTTSKKNFEGTTEEGTLANSEERGRATSAREPMGEAQAHALVASKAPVFRSMRCEAPRMIPGFVATQEYPGWCYKVHGPLLQEICDTEPSVL